MFAPITAHIPVGIRRPRSQKLDGSWGGLTKEVAFETVEGQFDDRIDDAYRAKYPSSPYLKPMISTRARSATVKIVPKD